jgi:polyhydroxybutyrate depolymerase
VAADADTVGSDAGVDDAGVDMLDATPPPPPPPPPWTVTLENLVVGGLTRSYTLSVPADYDGANSYPLVLVFHGDGETSTFLRGAMMFENASTNQAIVAYLDGVNHTWDLYDIDPNNHDFPFVTQLITSLAGTYNIDQNRVFGMGWSNGGYFVNELACNRPGLLAAIASNSGGAPGTLDPKWPLHYPNGYIKCVNNQAPTATFVIQGDVDPVVDVTSGQFDARYWAYVNKCSQTSAAVAPAPCVLYDNCPAATPVVYCEIPGLGHGLWSNTTSGAWGFFQSVRP